MANFSQSVEEQKTRKRAPFDGDLNFHSSLILSGQNFPSCLAVCLFVGVCLSISEPQCWAGPGWATGVSAMGWEVYVLQLRALSLVCLSWTAGQAVIIQTGLWTGCCVSLAWVTSHTHLLAQKHTFMMGQTGNHIHTHTNSYQKHMFTHSWTQEDMQTCMPALICTETHNNTLLITTKWACTDLCLNVIDHLQLSRHSAWRPVCLLCLFVSLFVWRDGWLACCLFMADHLSQ